MSNAETYIWHKTIIAFRHRTLSRGVALKSIFEPKQKHTVWGHFWQMCFSFFTKTAPHKQVTIDGKKTTTDAHAEFEIWEENHSLNTTAFDAKTAPIWVISDLDDTALISHTKSTAKRIFTLLFYRPSRRKGVPFTTHFLQTMHAAGALTFYVSRSEENLFGLMHNALKHVQMPEGPMFLTHFKSWKTVANKRNKKHFKEKTIAKILRQSTDKPAVLLGDDSQEDLQIYAEIYQQYPTRILGIFIRQTQKKEQLGTRNFVEELKQKNVPVVYFNHHFKGAEEAQSIIKNHLT